MMGSNRFRLDMPRYVDLYLKGDLKLDEMITARLPLTQVNDALDALRQGTGARSVVTFD
jgi:S-(hydroxymethyl)glutathione dehydrogenase/alcohol dehydrogenase